MNRTLLGRVVLSRQAACQTAGDASTEATDNCTNDVADSGAEDGASSGTSQDAGKRSTECAERALGNVSLVLSAILISAIRRGGCGFLLVCCGYGRG